MPSNRRKYQPIDLPIEPIWERQPDDSPKWFTVLERYRFAGRKRTKLGIYKMFLAEEQMAPDGERSGAIGSDRKNPASLPRAWQEAFDRFRFDERVQAWDRYLDDQQREMWDARLEEYREDCWKDRSALRERIELMLKVPLLQKEVISTGENGDAHVTIFKPMGWKLRDVILLIKASAELGALAIGDVNEAKATIERYGGRVVFDDDSEGFALLNQTDDFLIEPSKND